MLDHVILHVYRGAPTRGKPAPAVLACLYEARVDRFRLVMPTDFSELRSKLLQADLVSGYGLQSGQLASLFEIMDSAYRGSQPYKMMFPRTCDLVEKVVLTMGQQPDSASAKQIESSWTLECAVRGTLDRNRIGSSARVLDCIHRGDWSTAANLALDDTALIRDLINFESHYGYLIHEAGRTKIVTRFAAVRTSTTYADPVCITTPSLAPGGIPFVSPPLTQAPVSAERLTPPPDAEQPKVARFP